MCQAPNFLGFSVCPVTGPLPRLELDPEGTLAEHEMVPEISRSRASKTPEFGGSATYPKMC